MPSTGLLADYASPMTDEALLELERCNAGRMPGTSTGKRFTVGNRRLDGPSHL